MSTPDLHTADLSARKAEILSNLQRTMRRRTIRRRAARVGAALLLLAAVVPGVYLLRSPGRVPAPAPLAVDTSSHLPAFSPAPVAASGYTSIRVSQVSNVPAIAERLAVPTSTRSATGSESERPMAYVRFISDDELLQELAAAGRPAGLLRTPTGTILLTNAPTASAAAPTAPAGRLGDTPGIRGI